MNLIESQQALRQLAISDPERLISFVRPLLTRTEAEVIAEVEEKVPNPRTGIAVLMLKGYLRAAGHRGPDALNAATVALAISLAA